MIKNFVYLDQEKMYSLSSQLFEGITEYVLSENASDKSESESQKGPVGSGKVLGDVIISSTKATEKKFFHDYSFTLFERYLGEVGKVLDLTKPNLTINELAASINSFSFIKVKSKATFNDVNKITELFNQFNTIGEALAYVTNFRQMNEIKNEWETKPNSKEKTKKLAQLKEACKPSTLAKSSGLFQEPELLKNLSIVTKYGFPEQFEVTQGLGDVLFTSCLERKYLRETEDILVKKYSRKTEKELVVFGMISQSQLNQGEEPSEPEDEPEDEPDFNNMKAAILNLIDHLTSMENSLSGKQSNEIVIDPIAVYFEV